MLDPIAAPTELIELRESARLGDQAEAEMPASEKILTERRAQIVMQIEARIEEYSERPFQGNAVADLKEQLLVLCIALHEAGGVWNSLQSLAQQGKAAQVQHDELIQAQADANGQ